MTAQQYAMDDMITDHEFILTESLVIINNEDDENENDTER